MELTIGEFCTVVRGATVVTGQLMGYRIGDDGEIKELFIDGFYSAFEIGETDLHWAVLKEGEI